MDLEIEIIPIEKFEVRVDGKSIGEFEKKSSWEGMIKLQNEKGVIIVNDDRDIVDKIFHGIFDTEKQSSFSVVKITSSLIPTSS